MQALVSALNICMSQLVFTTVLGWRQVCLLQIREMMCLLNAKQLIVGGARPEDSPGPFLQVHFWGRQLIRWNFASNVGFLSCKNYVCGAPILPGLKSTEAHESAAKLKRYEVVSLTVAYGSLPKAAVIQQLLEKENEKLSQLSSGALRLIASSSLFKDACGMLMSAILEELQKRTQVSPELASPRKNFPQPPDPQVPGRAGLVITGKTLEFALQESLRKQFLELTAWCQAVICCRATPLQKSEVVKLVRNHLHVMTLAIGDGANDVSMIQVADIGIGVSGQEGMQAVMASDFAISQFRHLSKLLLVHGHWCYTRLSNMILYFFYKNVAYVNLLFWYQFFCGFSGTSMTDYWVLIFFNLLFTSVPPIIYGVLEKDVSAETLLQLPELYQSGQRSEEYLPLTFWITLLDAFYQSLVCFFVPYFTYQGSDIDIFTFGNPLNTAALLIILLHLVIESKSLTWIHMLVIVGSILSYFFFALAFGALCVTCNPPSNPYGIMQKHMLDPVFYLVCVLTTCVALLPRFVYRVLQGSVFPSPILRAKYFDRLSPEERTEALKRWRGTAKVNHVASKYASQSAAKSGRPRPGPSVAMKSATVCTIEQSTRETVLDLGYSKPGASTMTEPLAS